MILELIGKFKALGLCFFAFIKVFSYMYTFFIYIHLTNQPLNHTEVNTMEYSLRHFVMTFI